MDRRTLLKIASSAVVTSGLVGCAATAPTRAAHNALTVGLSYIPNVQFAAFYLGVERGIFQDHGLEVKLRHHGEQEEVFGALLGGQEDVVFAAADEAFVAAAEGKDLRTFATSYQTYPIQVLGLGDGPEDLSVLAGASVGIPGYYGASYYAARAAIHAAGLTTQEVEIISIGYTQVSALQSGKVDYVMGFSNNEAVQLRLLGLDPRAIAISETPYLVGPSLVAHGENISNDTLAKLAAGMKDSEEAVIADPEAALLATEKQVPALTQEKQREAAAAVLAATCKLWLKDGKVDVAIDPAAFEAMGSFLTEIGIIDAPPQHAYRQV